MPTSRQPALYFENAAGRLLADPAGFLRANWTSNPRTLADTRALFTHMSQALRQHNWSRIMINQLQMRPFSVEEQEWVSKEWIPRAVREGGYRHGAVVVSAEVMVRLATAYVTANVQGLPLVYRSFDAEAEALHWIQQQPVSPSW